MVKWCSTLNHKGQDMFKTVIFVCVCVCVVHNLLTFLAHYNERILYVMLVQI